MEDVTGRGLLGFLGCGGVLSARLARAFLPMLVTSLHGVPGLGERLRPPVGLVDRLRPYEKLPPGLLLRSSPNSAALGSGVRNAVLLLARRRVLNQTGALLDLASLRQEQNRLVTESYSAVRACEAAMVAEAEPDTRPWPGRNPACAPPGIPSHLEAECGIPPCPARAETCSCPLRPNSAPEFLQT